MAFDSVGPSPFHADFDLEVYEEEKNVREGMFTANVVDKPGYAKVRFKFCKDMVNSESGDDDIIESLFYDLRNELSLFYHIHRSDSNFIEDWRRIQSVSEEIKRHVRRDKWGLRLSVSIAHSRNLQKLYVSLVEFQIEHNSDEHYTNLAFRNIYKKGRSASLQNFVELALKDRFAFSINQMESLVKFLEKKRSKDMQLLVILMAAMFGAIAGSLLTVLSS